MPQVSVAVLDVDKIKTDLMGRGGGSDIARDELFDLLVTQCNLGRASKEA